MVVNKEIRYRTQRSNLSIHLHFPFAYLTNNMEKNSRARHSKIIEMKSCRGLAKLNPEPSISLNLI